MGTHEEPEGTTAATSEESINVPDPSGDVDKKQSYETLIKKAIRGLGRKAGVSRRAITRFILLHHSVKKEHAPDAIGRGLKRMVKSGRLLKSHSGYYKISPRGYQAKLRQRRESAIKSRALNKRKRRRSSALRSISAIYDRTRTMSSSSKKRKKPKKRKDKKDKKDRRDSSSTSKKSKKKSKKSRKRRSSKADKKKGKRKYEKDYR